VGGVVVHGSSKSTGKISEKEHAAVKDGAKGFATGAAGSSRDEREAKTIERTKDKQRDFIDKDNELRRTESSPPKLRHVEMGGDKYGSERSLTLESTSSKCFDDKNKRGHESRGGTRARSKDDGEAPSKKVTSPTRLREFELGRRAGSPPGGGLRTRISPTLVLSGQIKGGSREPADWIAGVDKDRDRLVAGYRGEEHYKSKAPGERTEVSFQD